MSSPRPAAPPGEEARMRGTRKKRRRDDDGLPRVPDGCQWSRRCEECPWPDCVLRGRRAEFDSPAGIDARSRMAVCLCDVVGLSAEEAAVLLCVSPRCVNDYVRSVRGFARLLARPRDSQVMREARKGTRSIEDLAEAFGVSGRTVSRIVARERNNH